MKTFFASIFILTSAFTTLQVNAQPGPPGDPGGGGVPGAGASPSVYSVQWTNLVGVAVSGNAVTKTASTLWGNGGASSINTLPANTDGWVEFQINSATAQTAIGLSTTDLNASYTSINFVFTTANGNVYENGAVKYTGTGTTAVYETFRIERIGGVINYKRNGTIVYTSAQTSSSSLIVDMAINLTGNTVSNVTCSFSAPSQPPNTVVSNNAVWQNMTGATVSTGNLLTKTSTDGWNAGASTLNILNPNTDGWAQFTIDNLNQQRAFGMSRTDIDVNYTSIDYAFLVNGSNASILLAGAIQSTFTVSVGDVLRVERIGSSIYFKQNEISIYTVSNGYTTMLIGDASLYGNGSTISTAQTSFWIPYQQGLVPDQREFTSLKNIYDSLGGSGWTTKTNWPTPGNWPATKTAAQMGTWYGVTVTNGDVTTVNLGNNNLIGTIPSTISTFGSLTFLSFQNNQIVGTIPSSIATLSNLTQLYLNANKLTGRLPWQLGNLTKLTNLSVAVNQLSDTIPSRLKNLTKLTQLALGPNNFTGNIPDLSNLTNLTALGIESCSALNSGPIPSWIYAYPKLTYLAIQGTNRTGGISADIQNLSLLTYLNLSLNQLSGSIPSSLGNLNNLVTLAIYSNNLAGSIPSALGNLNKLSSMLFNNNKLTGSIPKEIGNLSSLTILTFAVNKLTGSIPPEIGNLNKLTSLDFSWNQLSGSIPETLGNLINVTGFVLAQNQLSGSIPSSLGNLASVRSLYLYANKLTGELPSALGNMISCYSLRLESNQLTGPLPDLSKLTQLAQLIVNNNQLSGPILMKNFASAMVDFQIGGNKFSGLFPSLDKWTNLSGISIGSNQFSGDFPSISSLTKLDYIAAGSCQFASIPSAILSMKKVAHAYVYVGFDDNLITTITNLSVDIGGNNIHPDPSLTLKLNNNKLDFSQIEPLINVGIPTFTYSPQKTISDTPTQTLTTGIDFVITARPKGAFTSNIKWEKLQPNNTWQDISSANADPVTGNTYRISNATIPAEGNYRWSCTSTKATGFTLASDPIVVKTAARFTLDNLGFQYKYDARKRMTHKKVPGADWVYMVYDDRDRLVLTQDGNQRTLNQWMFTKYDMLNRPIMTGIKDTTVTLSQKDMQDVVDTYYSLITTTKPFRKYGETYVGGVGANIVHGYTNYAYPRVTTAATLDVNKYLTVTYYDNYSFLNGDNEYSYIPDDVAPQMVNGITYSQPACNTMVIGQVTGSKTKVMDTDVYWLKNVNYYDDKYRLVQSIAEHQRNNQLRTTNLYDFVGKVLASKISNVAQGVSWANKVAVNVSTSKITSTGNPSGASSAQQLAAGQSGWVEVTVTSVGPAKTEVGLSDVDVDQSYLTIDYGWFVQNTYAYTFDHGYQQGSGYPVVPGDVLRIERIGTTVMYKKNGVIVWTSQAPSNTLLIVDSFFNGINSYLLNVRTSFSNNTLTTTRTFEYDHAGRLQKTFHQVGTDPYRKILLSQNEYNEIGQLVDKKLYSTDGTAFKQSVDYRYNIRGWLQSMNNSQLSVNSVNNDDTNDLFGMELGYNNDIGTNNSPYYNGNISAIKRSNNLALGATKDVAYNYSYDAMNRITGASYFTNNAGWTNPVNAFSEGGLTYDLNGNIKTLLRKGSTGNMLDSLYYGYNGNQLLKVKDAGDKTNGFVDGANAGNDYDYDANGNMKYDLNKSLGTSLNDQAHLITYNYLNLPQQVVKNTGEKIVYTYDAGGRKLRQQVYNGAGVPTKTTDYDGEYIYQNDTLKFINHEEGRVIMNVPSGGTAATPPEYQYHLKDHLGNVRLTFTTTPITDANTATYEDANINIEQNKFLRYSNARRINAAIFDHTNGNSTTAGYSERLNGSANEIYGLARSMSVMPGDVINAEVYAKYVDPNSGNWTGALGTLMGQIVSSTAGVVVDGASYGSSTSSFPVFTGVPAKTSDNGGPKAYLNWLVFDRNFMFITGGYKQISTVGKENGTDVAHEYVAMPSPLTITQPGYVYIYLSNESGTPVEVYFDDFKVTQTNPLPVVQQEDFYPFGLSFNSYTRENTVPQNYLYNGKELQNDLSLDWYDYGARMYMPEIGRWGVVDPLSEVSRRWSPYTYAYDNPIRFIDPDGMLVTQSANGNTTYTGADAGLLLTTLKLRYGSSDQESKGTESTAEKEPDSNGSKQSIGSSYGPPQGEPNTPGGEWDSWGKGSVPYKGNALGGTNFIGPGPDVDPRTLPFKYVDEIDRGAFYHDITYFENRTGGVVGALFNQNVKEADLSLALTARSIIERYKSGNGVDEVTHMPISERTYNLALGVWLTFAPIVQAKYQREGQVFPPGGLYNPPATPPAPLHLSAILLPFFAP